MKTKIRVFAAMFFCGLVAQISVAWGQMKLDDLVQYSLGHSRDIKKSDLQVKEAGYLRLETAGKGLPQIEASVSYSKMTLPEISISDSIAMMIPEQYAPILGQLGSIDALYMASAGVQVTQLIYSQSYLVGLKTTRKAKEMYELLKNKTEEDVIEEVANTYYQTFSIMLQLNTLSKSLVNLNEIYRIVDLNYQNDLVKESSVNRLKVTIINLEVNQQTLENVIGIQLNYIKALAGMPSDTVISIDTTSLNQDMTLAGINTGFSVDNVPSYQLLLKQKELNHQQVKLERATFFPTLAAFGKFDYSSYNTKSEIEKWNNINTIGVQVSVPIFSSGSNYAKVKQAQLKQAQTEETLLKTRDLLTIGYNNAYSEYQTAYKLLDVQKENRDLALKVYNQTSSLYKEGMASMADLLNVNSDYLQAENSYNQQILKCKLSEIKMLKSTGNLKELVNNK